MRFIVRFLDMSEQTKDEFEYSNLLDALKVVKSTPLDGVIMSNPAFELDLIVLLTSGFIYAGPKASGMPAGKYMIQLLKQVENGAPETPVYGPHIVPFVAGTLPVQRIESQLKSNSVNEMYPIIKPVSPVAESNMDSDWITAFENSTERDKNFGDSRD